MKKVIKGKLYNTETATFVANYVYLNPTDFRYTNEELYITIRGNWFLFVEGGPMSKYAKPSWDGGMTSGCDIIEFTPEEAYNMLELWNKIKAIEKYFSSLIEEA